MRRIFVGGSDAGRIVEELKNGCPFLFLRLEGFGGDRRINLISQCRRGQGCVDEARLCGTDHSRRLSARKLSHIRINRGSGNICATSGESGIVRANELENDQKVSQIDMMTRMGNEFGLPELEEFMRDASRAGKPLDLAKGFCHRTGEMIAADRTMVVSRRGLNWPNYRVLEGESELDLVWNPGTREWEQLPVLSGGLLAELLYAGAAQVIDPISLRDEDPAREKLVGMKVLAAVPLFDEGQTHELILYMRKESAEFAQEQVKEIVLLTGLISRTMQGLALAEELRGAKERLQEEFRAATELSDTILEQALELKHHASKLEERVRQRTEELEIAHRDAIYMLAAAAEEKDDNTGEHVRRMQELSYQLARQLGQGEAQALTVGQAAILHDVGKLHVPDGILKKPGPLTAQEREVMQDHTLAGERILAERAHLDPARRVARSHHENWDGSGYPDGLSGDQISIEARIVHLADVYDALTHARAYKRAWGHEEAMEFIRREKGKMFDPSMVEALEAMTSTNGHAQSPAAGIPSSGRSGAG
jgi:HD-GYP domain-containing protein (c-di-GMP phosphodiesterase class II)